MSNLNKIDEGISESILKENDTLPCQSMSELINLNLNDYSSNLKSSEITEYFSSPSKSSSQEYSPLESSKFKNCLLKSTNDKNNNNLDETKNEADKHVTKLFVGNLPTSTTLPELLTVFKKYGPVNEALSVVKDHNYAFIHFYNRQDAEVALREVNDSLFKDRYIRVQFSTSQNFTNANKHKGSEKRRHFGNFANSLGPQNKSGFATQSSIPYSQSSPMLSNSSFYNNGNNFNMTNRSWRPITAGKMPNSQSALFDRSFVGSSSSQTNFNNVSNSGPSFQSNLLIEASKLKNVKLNHYNHFHDDLQHKQQFIQALYLRQQQQQQQQLFQHQIQQQLQQQIQKSQPDIPQQNFSIPKSNTTGNFDLGFNALYGLIQNLNLNTNDKILNQKNLNN